MRSLAAPLCSRLACRIVGVAAVLLVTLGGLRLLVAAEPLERAAQASPALRTAIPETRPTSEWAALAVEYAAWTPRASELDTALAGTATTCAAAFCGFDRIDHPLRPSWRAAPSREPGPASLRPLTWAGDVSAPPPAPDAGLLRPAARPGIELLRPGTLRAAF